MNKDDKTLELIARFMGYTIKYVTDTTTYLSGPASYPLFTKDGITTDKVYFNTSWDWLMLVINKIENLMPNINIPEDLDSLRAGTHGSEPHLKVVSLPISTSFNEAYQEVVKFIENYNNDNGK